MYIKYQQTLKNSLTINSNNNGYNINELGLLPKSNYSVSNINNDILLNPYSAPLRDDRIFNGKYNLHQKLILDENRTVF